MMKFKSLIRYRLLIFSCTLIFGVDIWSNLVILPSNVEGIRQIVSIGGLRMVFAQSRESNCSATGTFTTTPDGKRVYTPCEDKRGENKCCVGSCPADDPCTNFAAGSGFSACYCKDHTGE